MNVGTPEFHKGFSPGTGDLTTRLWHPLGSGEATPSVATLKRVLFVSYAFPPTGGGGVQRAVKFAKYLPACGWRPTILTAANPSVPVQDHDFDRDLDPQTEILTARTWEPGYNLKKRLAAGPHSSGTAATSRWQEWLRRSMRKLSLRLFQPDPQVLWNVSAYRCAARRLTQLPHDAILVTGPPFSSFAIGCKLKRRFNVPLILDFRDEWMLAGRYLDNYQQSQSSLRRQRATLHKILRDADAVVTTTQASADELRRCCAQASSSARVTCIYNGFDPEDILRADCERRTSATFQIVYTGTLWRLTDASPLVTALEMLADGRPELASRIELIVAGRRTAAQDSLLQRLRSTRVRLVCHDYLPHGQALELAAGADCLLLLLAAEEGAERVVPAKLFEYLALNKPILSIVPHGETRELLCKHGNDEVCSPDNPKSIVSWIAARLHGESVKNGSHQSAREIERFSRLSLARELALLLDSCRVS